MTTGRRFAASALGALAVVGFGIGAGLIVFGDSPLSAARRGTGHTDRPIVEVSSLDLGADAANPILSGTDMAPGDVVTRVVTLTNASRDPIAYAMSVDEVTADSAVLASVLQLTIRTVGSSCADLDGASLYSGPLQGAAFGDGSAARHLSGASADILCFRVELPLEAGNEFQSLATPLSVSFSAAWDVRTP